MGAAFALNNNKVPTMPVRNTTNKPMCLCALPITISFIVVAFAKNKKTFNSIKKKPPVKEAFTIIWHRAIFPGVNPKYCNRYEA